MSESHHIDSGMIALNKRTVEGWLSNWKRVWGGNPLNRIAMAIALEQAAQKLRQEVADQK